MLEDIKIKNFKIFRDAHFDRFKRINLFVGRNGAGKTCLLEAIYLYLAQFNAYDAIIDILRSRDVSIIDLSFEDEGGLFSSPLRSLFSGYFIPTLTNGISLSDAEGHFENLHIVTIRYQETTDAKGIIRIVILDQDDIDNNNQFIKSDIAIKIGEQYKIINSEHFKNKFNPGKIDYLTASAFSDLHTAPR